MGVEPTRPFGQGILSPQRLPFRHSAYSHNPLLSNNLRVAFVSALRISDSKIPPAATFRNFRFSLVNHPAEPDRYSRFQALLFTSSQYIICGHRNFASEFFGLVITIADEVEDGKKIKYQNDEVGNRIQELVFEGKVCPDVSVILWCKSTKKRQPNWVHTFRQLIVSALMLSTKWWVKGAFRACCPKRLLK